MDGPGFTPTQSSADFSIISPLAIVFSRCGRLELISYEINPIFHNEIQFQI